ncbi:MAG: hypothetical protein O7J95_17660 [Planctomycetota bacterium]|nr:hypothetical protein [Planctomycetota bacterium]
MGRKFLAIGWICGLAFGGGLEVVRLPAQEQADAPPAKKDDEKGSGNEKETAKKAGGDPEKGADEKPKKPGAPVIPELPRDQLPPRTRAKPDPKKQYVKETVYVKVAETARARRGKAYTPRVPVIQQYLGEYFRRAGYPVVSSAESADYRVEGSFETAFLKVITFREQVIAWKYRGKVTLQVLGRQGRVAQKIDVPEYTRDSVKDEKSCILDMRRYFAKELYDEMFNEGPVFANKPVAGLLAALNVDPLEAEEPLSGNEIIQRLADVGLPAVPYLLEAMTDTGDVLAETEYPGLARLEDLKVYHVADKVLEEIFQKVSRMDLATDDYRRLIITLGWENEWRRFCPPFRDSPSYKRRLEREARQRARQEAASPDGEAGSGR